VSQAVAYQAISDTVLTGSSSEARWRFYLYCRQQGRWPLEVGGHDPDREPEWFGPYCPGRNVTAAYPPTLLIHGTVDTDVPFEQSALMADELDRQGVDSQLITMVNRGHGFEKAGAGLQDPETAAAFDQILAFLSKRLTGGASL
jgi:dipeptidyl aminopeptidase/acylaminoacyl peptidase